jgi:heat shock protein HslJ
MIRAFSAALLGLSLCACHTTPKTPAPPDAPKLPGTAWLLEDLGGSGVIDNAQTTLAFADGGKISGRGACNRYFGTAEIAGDKIKFGKVGSTMMACPEAVMDQETRYFKALNNAERFSIEGPYLLIYAKDLPKPLKFTRTTTP